jgi:hypothetical protein
MKRHCATRKTAFKKKQSPNDQRAAEVPMGDMSAPKNDRGSAKKVRGGKKSAIRNIIKKRFA